MRFIDAGFASGGGGLIDRSKNVKVVKSRRKIKEHTKW
jgi:hypothetical protein